MYGFPELPNVYCIATHLGLMGEFGEYSGDDSSGDAEMPVTSESSRLNFAIRLRPFLKATGGSMAMIATPSYANTDDESVPKEPWYGLPIHPVSVHHMTRRSSSVTTTDLSQ
jgi:hypothetical protein